MNKSILLATVVGSLITNTVTADYTGLDYTAIDNGDGTWTARIFAEFSAPTDELHWVFGDSSNDLFITSRIQTCCRHFYVKFIVYCSLLFIRWE